MIPVTTIWFHKEPLRTFRSSLSQQTKEPSQARRSGSQRKTKVWVMVLQWERQLGPQQLALMAISISRTSLGKCTRNCRLAARYNHTPPISLTLSPLAVKSPITTTWHSRLRLASQCEWWWMPKCSSRFSKLIIVKRKRVRTAAPTYQRVEEHMRTRTRPYMTSIDILLIKCLNQRTCKQRPYLARFKAIALDHTCRHKIIQKAPMVPNNRLSSSSSFQICRWLKTQLQQPKSLH